MALFENFLEPILFFWLIIVSSFVFYAAKRHRTSGRLLILALTWLAIVTVSPFSQWVVNGLESQYPKWSSRAIHSDTTFYHILVLGGGHTNATDLPSTDQLMTPALARLIEGIRIHQLVRNSKILCSGSSSSNRVTQAQVLADAAVSLGINPRDTLQLRLGKKTIDEIRSYRQRFGSGTRVILVTSAYHMPRAIMMAKNEGLNVEPAPTNYYLKRDSLKQLFDFRPSADKIQMLQSALHEYGGILKYKYLSGKH